MNGAWASSLDQLWRSPAWPMLAVAAFVGIVVLVALVRAPKSVANGALAVIALLAIAVAAAATIRSSSPPETARAAIVAPMPPLLAPVPALACLDEMAGDAVLAACEKTLFGSAEMSAAAVSYAAAKINRLTSYGDVASADKDMTADLTVLRRAVERDRYGLMAYVLQSRDRCQPDNCAAFAALTDHKQITANMEERAYDGLIVRYMSTWNAPPPTSLTSGVLAALPPSVPTGKPTTADFPSAASIPPISIMTPEPAPRAPASATQAPRPAATTAAPATGAPAAAKKQAAPKAPRPQAQAPVSLAPAPAEPDN